MSPSSRARGLPQRTPRRTRARGLRLLTAQTLGAAACLLGCTGGSGPPPEPPPRYEDLVTDGSLARANGTSTTGEIFCADETRFGVTVEAGAAVRLSTDLGTEPTLLLSACTEDEGEDAGDPESGGPGDAWLTVTVEGERGLSSEMRLDLPEGRWVERSLALPAHAGGQVGLRLSTGPRPVRIADLAVRHRLPAAASKRSGADGGWSRLWRGKREPPRRILLISIDTLRHDAVGALAEPSDRSSLTPSLDAFAAQAEVWTSLYAAASWTKPSHASMLTGVSPAVHGAVGIEDPMAPEVETLAERFSAAGLATAALVYDCRWLAPDFGFAQGFHTYSVVPWRASQEVRGAASWMAEHGEQSEQGFFYFLHLFTPHSDSRLLPYEGGSVSRGSVEHLFGVADYGCRRGRCASSLLKSLNEGLEPLSEEPEILRHLYDGGVRDVDRALGRLFRDLEAAGLWDSMTVVVTSDHGEAFFEHGRVLHDTLHEEILQVPLLVKWPGGEGAGARHGSPASAVDLAPTLLAAAGLPVDDLPGTPLARRHPDAPVVAGTLDRTLIQGDWKLMVPLRGGPVALYDLDSDPLERHDLAADPRHAERVERLRDLYEAQMEIERQLRASIGIGIGVGTGEGARPTLTPEERERLEALGYL